MKLKKTEEYFLLYSLQLSHFFFQIIKIYHLKNIQSL